MPKNEKYKQVQVFAEYTEPIIGVLSDQVVASMYETAVRQLWDIRGGRNLEITTNEGNPLAWDWVVLYNVDYGGTKLMGTTLV